MTRLGFGIETEAVNADMPCVMSLVEGDSRESYDDLWPDVWMTSSHGITQLHPLPTFAACKGQRCITAVLQKPPAATRLHDAESTALREIIKKEE